MAPKPSPKQKGMELKASNKAASDAVAAKERERQEAEDWKQGGNNKGAAKASSAGKFMFMD